MLPWTPRNVTLALAQFAMESDPAANLARAIDYIRRGAQAGAQIVCLPELFRSPYFCRTEQSPRDYAEAVPGEVGAVLCQVAKELGVAIVGGSVYERASDGTKFNTSLVINAEGALVGTYRKAHIPHDPAFFERNYFAEGDGGFRVFDLGIAKIGVLICYDQWFPEAARTVALMGAEIIFYPTAIGTVGTEPAPEGDWQLAWETVQRGHAVANSVVVAAVNRVGQEGDSTFWGGSFVSDGFGKLLVKGGNTPDLLVTKVDLAHSTFTRDGWRFFASRRPELYGAVAATLTEEQK